MAQLPEPSLPSPPASDQAVLRQIRAWGENFGWRIGRQPQNDAEWLLDLQALVREAEDRVDRQPTWLIGRPPEGPEEVDAEVRLRNLEKRWEVDLQDRRHRADLEYQNARQASRGESVRSFVLIAVVAAVVFTPIYAMIANVEPQASDNTSHRSPE